jgi:hypothetical protein
VQCRNRFFIDAADTTYKFELGGVNHEACAGWAAVGKCAPSIVQVCERLTVRMPV